MINNITQTQEISSLSDLSLHIPSSSFAVCHSHDPHICLSLSYSFLLVASWWLSYSYRCFLPLCESHNVCTRCHKCHIFMTWINPGHMVSWTKFCGTWGQNTFKTHKTRTMPGKPGWLASQYVAYISIMHTKKVPVHTIQSRSTICVTQFVNHTSLI